MQDAGIGWKKGRKGILYIEGTKQKQTAAGKYNKHQQENTLISITDFIVVDTEGDIEQCHKCNDLKLTAPLICKYRQMGNENKNNNNNKSSLHKNKNKKLPRLCVACRRGTCQKLVYEIQIQKTSRVGKNAQNEISCS
jgi:hypothetical protein